MEFVTALEVLTAVNELRRIRDTEGTIKYIGISGYPVKVICDLAELILKETGEPLDCVMSYANLTLQNRRLKMEGLSRLKAAGVSVVPNASMLGMGLLRSGGVPVGALGDWHPAPKGLRMACQAASDYCDSIGEKLEVVAIRWALETWLIEGERVGSKGDAASGPGGKSEAIDKVGGRKLGVSVIGVSNLQELKETVNVWRSILAGLGDSQKGVPQAERRESDYEWSLRRRYEIQAIAGSVWEKLGEWLDFAWASPGEDYVRVQPAIEEE